MPWLLLTAVRPSVRSGVGSPESGRLDVGAIARWTPDEPTAGRAWLVWFRRLSTDGEAFRASVSEMALLRS